LGNNGIPKEHKAAILVVDDEPNILRLMVDVLKKFGGYSVDQSMNDGKRECIRLAISVIGGRAMPADGSPAGSMQRVNISFAVFSEQLIIMIEDSEGKSLNFDTLYPPVPRTASISTTAWTTSLSRTRNRCSS
jgi:hypothetical protein